METLLPNIVTDAPVGRVDVEIRRLVRLVGEGVVRILRRESGCELLETGNLVGNLAAYRLLRSESRLVVSESLRSCLTISSMSSTLGG